MRLGYDDSLFSGPTENPHWRADYIPDDVVSPITALWVDEGRAAIGFGRVADPAAGRRVGVRQALWQAGDPGDRGARGDRAPTAPRTRSRRSERAPLAQIVQRILEVSDNEAAEVLLRHVGLADQGDGSFDGGRRGRTPVLEANGVDCAPACCTTAAASPARTGWPAQLLSTCSGWPPPTTSPTCGRSLTGLPVAGFTGSLADRFDQGAPEGRGRVRAKTGTLTGVTSLAGIAADLDGDAMVFVLMADRVRKNRDGLAQVAMDNAAAALGACRCASVGS